MAATCIPLGPRREPQKPSHPPKAPDDASPTSFRASHRDRPRHGPTWRPPRPSREPGGSQSAARTPRPPHRLRCRCCCCWVNATPKTKGRAPNPIRPCLCSHAPLPPVPPRRKQQTANLYDSLSSCNGCPFPGHSELVRVEQTIHRKIRVSANS